MPSGLPSGMSATCPRAKLGVDVEQDFGVTYVVPEDSKKHVAELKRAMKGRRPDPRHRLRPRGRGDRVPRGDPARSSIPASEARRRSPRSPGTRSSRRSSTLARSTSELFDAQEARRVLDRLVGLPDQPDPVAPGAAGSVGRPRAVGRRPADRGARARDPGVQPGRVLEHRRPAHARGPRAAASWPASPRSPRASSPPRPTRRASCSAPKPTPPPHVDRLGRAATGSPTSSRKERKRSPAPPFTTSTLQQEAARKLGFGARKTMTIAQRLYEGVDLPGEGTVGLITYMRTDSVNDRRHRACARSPSS